MNLNYAYGMMEPQSGLSHLTAEHERCVLLWDRLIHIDNDWRDQIQRASREAIPELHDLDKAIDDLSQAIAAADKDHRKPLYIERRGLRAKTWDLEKQWRKDNKETYRAIERDRQTAVKEARQETEAWWPNYNAVIARYEAGRQVALQKGRRMRHHDPARVDGILALQIQRTRSGLGASPDEIHQGISMIHVHPVAEYTRTGMRTMMRWRVDRDGNEVEAVVYFDRPLPSECRIKGAQMTWRRVADEIRWQVLFQITGVQPSSPPAYTRTGSVMLTYEEYAGGLLVAQTNKRYILPPEWIQRMKHVRSLQSWLDESKKERAEQHPDCGALQMPDRDMMDILLGNEAHKEWRLEYKKLWLEMYHLRDKLLRQRREYYRLWAREIVREYPDLEMDDTDYSKIAKADKHGAANSLRQLACPHQLRDEIIHQANKAGCRVSARGKVLTCNGEQKSGVWQRRKAAKQDRSRHTAEAAAGQGRQG